MSPELAKKFRNLKPDKPLIYFTGSNIGHVSTYRLEVDEVRRFTRALFELGVADLFQKRRPEGTFDYIVVVRGKRLGVCRDGSGSFQEAERLASQMESFYANCYEPYEGS